MPGERGARDRRFEVAVEGVDASGAASTFDGNHTDDTVSWLFANETWRDEKFSGLLDKLMWYTAAGNLSWVVFPPEGFRIPDAY